MKKVLIRGDCTVTYYQDRQARLSSPNSKTPAITIDSATSKAKLYLANSLAYKKFGYALECENINSDSKSTLKVKYCSKVEEIHSDKDHAVEYCYRLFGKYEKLTKIFVKNGKVDNGGLSVFHQIFFTGIPGEVHVKEFYETDTNIGCVRIEYIVDNKVVFAKTIDKNYKNLGHLVKNGKVFHPNQNYRVLNRIFQFVDVNNIVDFNYGGYSFVGCLSIEDIIDIIPQLKSKLGTTTETQQSVNVEPRRTMPGWCASDTHSANNTFNLNRDIYSFQEASRIFNELWLFTENERVAALGQFPCPPNTVGATDVTGNVSDSNPVAVVAQNSSEQVLEERQQRVLDNLQIEGLRIPPRTPYSLRDVLIDYGQNINRITPQINEEIPF